MGDSSELQEFRENFARKMQIDEDELSIEALLRNRCSGDGTDDGRQAPVWVDLGGGCGRAQAELTDAFEKNGEQVECLNVDVVDRSDLLMSKYSLMPPPLKIADAATVTLDKKPDLITGVFSTPYWEDQLNGIVNAYNQLREAGLLILASSTDYRWSRGIRDPKDDRSAVFPMTRFRGELKRSNVPFATLGHVGAYAHNERASQQFHLLTIRKLADTSMRLDAELENVTFYPPGCYLYKGAKIATYRSDTSASPISVIREPLNSTQSSNSNLQACSV